MYIITTITGLFQYFTVDSAFSAYTEYTGFKQNGALIRYWKIHELTEPVVLFVSTDFCFAKFVDDFNFAKRKNISRQFRTYFSRPWQTCQKNRELKLPKNRTQYAGTLGEIRLVHLFLLFFLVRRLEELFAEK